MVCQGLLRCPPSWPCHTQCWEPPAWCTGMSSLPALGMGPGGGGCIPCFFLTRSHCYRCVCGDAPVLQQSGQGSCGNTVRLSLLLPSLCIFPKCPLSVTTGKRDLVGCLCAPSAEEGQGIYAIYSTATRPCPDPLAPNPSVPFPLRSSPMAIKSLFWFSVPTFAFFPFSLRSV